MPEYPQRGLRQIDPRSRFPMESEYPAYEGQVGPIYDTGESVYTPIYRPRETYDPMHIDSTQGPKLQEAKGLREQEPNVPRWAGDYPNVYAGLGMVREMIQPFMRGGLADVALSRAVGYPTPEFMTEREQMGMPISGGLFSKTAPITRPQIWVRQHPSGGFVAQSGVGAEGRMITSGKTIEEVMGKAKAMSPGHDIKVLKETPSVPVKAPMQAQPIPEQRADYGLREKIQKLKDEGNIDELEKLIYEDPLTGVRNRRAFEEVYPEAMKQGKNFAPMDASGLKYINDTYGHEAGDTFLKEYTKALKNEGVDLYRMGGDEMVAIFGKGDYGKLKKAAHNFSNKEIQIQDLKGNPVVLKGAKFDFGVGKTLESGDVALLKKRAGTEAAGTRAARGEKPVGLSEFTKAEALAELKRRRQQ